MHTHTNNLKKRAEEIRENSDRTKHISERSAKQILA